MSAMMFSMTSVRATGMRLSLLTLLSVTNLYLPAGTGAQISERFLYNNNRPTPAIDDVLSRMEEDPYANTIPMELARAMNNSTASQFIERFVSIDQSDPQLGLKEKLKNDVERALGGKVESAICMPDNAVIKVLPLNYSREQDVMYHPRCVRVKRCSGCCNSPLLACQPVKTNITDVPIDKYKIIQKNGAMRLSLVGKDHALIEQHLSCTCACRIKKEHCNPYQRYDESECKCICKNSEAREKCMGQDDKNWDVSQCKCICQRLQSCTTGTTFDETQCKCVAPFLGYDISRSQFNSTEDRRKYIIPAKEADFSTTYDEQS